MTFHKSVAKFPRSWWFIVQKLFSWVQFENETHMNSLRARSIPFAVIFVRHIHHPVEIIRVECLLDNGAIKR